jgi:hypothetical protein
LPRWPTVPARALARVVLLHAAEAALGRR